MCTFSGTTTACTRVHFINKSVVFALVSVEMFCKTNSDDENVYFHLSLFIQIQTWPGVFGSSYPGADLMQAGGDGFGWRVTAEHMTFQDPGVFIPSHICKVPGREKNKGSVKTHGTVLME